MISKRTWRVYSCMLVHRICLYFSFFFCARSLTQVVVDLWFKILKYFTKWRSSWRLFELNRRIISPLQDDMICPSLVLICSAPWIVCFFIYASLSLCHSPRHDSRRRSLLILVSSHSDTHTTSMGTWYAAGATKSWLHSSSWSKSFTLIKKISTQPIFSIWMRR